MDDIDPLHLILKQNRVVAVVGLSANWWRPSYFVAKYLKEHGYRVIPVNPAYQEVLGEKCYATLDDVPSSINMVDRFRKAREIPSLAEEAIRLGVKMFVAATRCGQRCRRSARDWRRARCGDGSLRKN